MRENEVMGLKKFFWPRPFINVFHKDLKVLFFSWQQSY